MVSSGSQKRRATNEAEESSAATVLDIVNSCVQGRHLNLQLASSEEALNKLIGRESEMGELKQFMMDSITSNKGTSAYVCGSAGTGKSASICQILEELENWVNTPGSNNKVSLKSTKKRARTGNEGKKTVVLDIVKLNGNTFGSPGDIFGSIYRELMEKRELATEPLSAKEACDSITDLIVTKYPSRKQKIRIPIFVVDEVDRLLRANTDVLHQLFSWPFLPNSNLILIGIANTINLPKQFLSSLRDRAQEPRLLQVFTAYQRGELAAIMRLNLVRKFAGEAIRFDLAAVEVIARKLEKTGDARKAVDLCTRAVEAATMEQRAKAEQDENTTVNGNDGLEGNGKLGQSNNKNIVHVTPKHAIQASSAVFGSAHVKLITALPQHSRLAICAAVLQKRQAGGFTTRDLFTKYRLLADQLGLTKLSFNQFSSQVTERLDQTGLIRLGKKNKKTNSCSIQLMATERDVSFALQDSSTFSLLLNPPGSQS